MKKIKKELIKRKKSKRGKLTLGKKEDQEFGGVCSGLANYLNIDVTFIRIVLLVSIVLYGFGTTLYAILWIAMPDHPDDSIKKVDKD